MADITPSPTVFTVNVKNVCTYPVRVLTWIDEETGRSTTYSVFKQFERRKLEINLLTLRHLQQDPKVRLSKV